MVHGLILSSGCLSTSATSSMSVRIATTYTSAVPTTPLTSVSRCLSAACHSAQVSVANKAKSSDPNKVKLALFGFELTVSCELTEIPRWLRKPPDRDRWSAPTHSRPLSADTAELSGVEERIFLDTSAFALQWFGRSLFEDIFILVTVGGLLWLIFGGWQELEHLKYLTEPPSGVECAADQVANAQSEIASVELAVPSQDSAPLLEQSCDVVQDREKVQEWLNTHQDATSSDGSESPSPDDQDCTTVIIAGDNASQHEDLADDESLAPIETPSEAIADEEDVEEIYPNEQQLAIIQKQHEFPVFVLENPYDGQGPHHQQCLKTKQDVLYTWGRGEWMFETDEWPGRPIEADEKDIDYMLAHLLPHLPQWLVKELRSHTLDELIRTRLPDDSNPYLEALAVQWYMVFPGTLAGRDCRTAITSLADVRKIVEATRRKFTPECDKDERDFVGLDHPKRPYLTDAEEHNVNESNCDYNYSNIDIVTEQSHVLLRLRKLPGHGKIGFTNQIPGWVASLDESEFLDPNSFYGCECGELAVDALRDYREEMEHNYKETKGHESCFPITFLGDSELDPLYARMQQFPEAPARTTPPRSQKILQCCNLHKTGTDNIFILVDTSVEDINDRLSDPQGGLFAPGTTLPRYPDGFRTMLGFKEISYEELPPRCVHGVLHSHACEKCFPHGHDEDNCAECVQVHPLSCGRWTKSARSWLLLHTTLPTSAPRRQMVVRRSWQTTTTPTGSTIRASQLSRTAKSATNSSKSSGTPRVTSLAIAVICFSSKEHFAQWMKKSPT